VSLALANATKKEASRIRAEQLLSLQSGLTTIPDLILAASSEDSRALRRITLRQLLISQEGWGEARVHSVLSRTSSLLGLDPTSRLTVAWLIDARAGGRRLRAFADARSARVTPWTGFPYAPLPAGGGSA